MRQTKEVKAKGTKKCVSNTLQFEEFERCLLDRNAHILKEQHIFRSKLHEVYTEKIRKVALNSNDDKRFILEDGIHTLALGHYKIPEN